jgi:ArsR family transcriptional regulator, arsenate/arsenite/antimonite-responsive transcriptional repressor
MIVNGSGTIRSVAKAIAVPERERGVCCAVPLEFPRQRAQQTAEVLKALADPTRLQMILALRAADQPVCICDFTATFSLSQPTVSHHMGKLREAGLVESARQGIWAYYRLRHDLPPRVRAILDALA